MQVTFYQQHRIFCLMSLMWGTLKINDPSWCCYIVYIVYNTEWYIIVNTADALLFEMFFSGILCIREMPMHI